MKTIYLECNMGAAGDMLSAALYELCTEAQKEEFLHTMHHAGFGFLRLLPERAQQCGITGTHMRVLINGAEEAAHLHTHACANEREHAHDHDHDHAHEHDHDHAHEHDHDHAHEHDHDHAHEHDHDHAHEHDHDHDHAHEHDHDHAHEHDHAHDHALPHTHGSYVEITAQLAALRLPEAVKHDASAVYRLLADAESRVHGVTMEQIHFHEVGTLDALADITGVCLLLHLLQPDSICASCVATGSGTVRCAHGVLPVPAPAAALLLEGVLTCAGSEQGELCTPTGAALLRYFVAQFGPRPAMTLRTVGYGMGTKQFSTANCVRAFLGETAPESTNTCETEAVALLCCNLDDMTPEAIAFAMENLLEQGAQDVYTTPIGMKKSRAATKLSVLCRAEEANIFACTLLTHTTTLGVRKALHTRYTLPRDVVKVETPYGTVRMKVAYGGGTMADVRKVKPEYDDLAAAARKANVPLSAVETAALAAWRECADAL